MMRICYLLSINDYNARKQKAKFCFKSLTDEYCLHMFRFNKCDIPILQVALKIPPYFILEKGSASAEISGIEALCILLRLAYPNRLSDLYDLFNRCESSISEIFNYTLNHVYINFNILLISLDQEWLNLTQLVTYNEVIVKKGSPLMNCIGFIDGTIRGMCRPIEEQEEFYNKHKRIHSIKYQAITLPNGLIANLSGPYSGRHHDGFMLSDSKIIDKLDILFRKVNAPPTMCIFGDQGYPLKGCLQVPYKGHYLSDLEEEFNKRMGNVRKCVEWSFGKVITLFAFVDFQKNLKYLL